MMDVQKIMEQVQVYASTYSLVGGRFDDGTRMEQAREEKAEIEAMLCAVADENDSTDFDRDATHRLGKYWSPMPEPIESAAKRVAALDHVRCRSSKWGGCDAGQRAFYRETADHVMRAYLEALSDAAELYAAGHGIPGIFPAAREAVE